MHYNRLKDEKSLYLRQHQENPVDWWPWGTKALRQAKKENKPILLSIGYSACHWCHVMGHESFSDPQTAELMNNFFINIKVDREERPDIDSVYQEALYLLGRQGGWPLTMFLTPEAKPFFGGTYFPAEMGYGMPNFREVLWQVAQLWRKDQADANKNADNIYEGLRSILATSKSGNMDMPQEKIDELAETILPLIDPDNGGFGSSNKFPNVMALSLLWQVWRCGSGKTEERKLFAASVRLSLDRMCQGGIYDHLGGGFSRYTVDDNWLTPHFEKMLYDNALIVDVLTNVWRETRNPLYQARIEQTISWLMHEMRLENGAFAASLDADSDGDEGAYYLWEAAEIKKALGADANKFMSAYGVSDTGNCDGKNILNRLHAIAWDKTIDEDMAGLRAKLLKKRRKRVAPVRDNKILTDWNGLVIAALTEAAMAFDRKEWLDAAINSYDFIVSTMVSDDGRGLHHSWCDGKANKVSFADDYACMSHAALTLYEATGDDKYLKQAEQWIFYSLEFYEDSTKGGFFKSRKDNKDLLTAVKEAKDAAVPSSNGLLMRCFARVYGLTGNPLWREQARRVLGAFSGDVNEYVFAHSSLLFGQSLLINPTQIVLVGTTADDNFEELKNAVWQTPQPNRVFSTMADTSTLGVLHPAFGKTKQNGKSTAYVCFGQVCLPAITDSKKLVDVLTNLNISNLISSDPSIKAG